mgnify:CR=1 FL=1
MKITYLGHACFRVEADGMVVNRRFKSVTEANEWIAKHTI